ncbi:hypothetical protein BDB00DRAFT_789602 [Zychaea mexicana]|uniref:uncharacterized protein n=1 Tax=Zychaea mexicana TaxID=64656 RepID=UPI0022FF2B98|nr:uncharacterized protein BDB00DRAFT_789602 [Zychaea mexicana]KAI9491344.1 hypothetical protein BDB00DRAFT_789602 [Zychaea mexicana]
MARRSDEMQLATRLVNNPKSDPCEDTFVHRYLDALFDGVLCSDPLIETEWANAWMNSSKEDRVLVYKPDYIVFVKPHNVRFDIAACEVKAPKKTAAPPVSDYVKLCIEMKRILLSLGKDLIDAPYVLGILVTGGLHTPSSVQLAKAPIITTMASFGSFPILLRAIIQVKNLARRLALDIEKKQLAMASTGFKRSISAPQSSMPKWKKNKKR